MAPILQLLNRFMPFLQLLAIVLGFVFLKQCTGPVPQTAEQSYRQEVEQKMAPVETRQTIEKHYYHNTIVKNDQELEQAWERGEVKADTVIKSKNNRIKKVETLLVRCDSLRDGDSTLIDSYKREIIGLRPRNRYFITASASNNNLSAGGLLVTKKGYIFGYKYGLLLRSHEATIGIQIK